MIFNSIFELNDMKGKTIKKIYVTFTGDDEEVVSFNECSACRFLNDGITYSIDFKNGIIVDDKFIKLIKNSNACYRNGIEQYFEYGEIKYLKTSLGYYNSEIGYHKAKQELEEYNDNIKKRI